MKKGDAGRAEARRRFAATAAERSGWPVEWRMEDLLDKPGARGAAQAAARSGNASARRALVDLDRAVTETVSQLHTTDQGGQSAPANQMKEQEQ